MRWLFREGQDNVNANTDCICMTCAEKEKQDKDYEKAVKADHEEIKKGNYNYKGIKG